MKVCVASGNEDKEKIPKCLDIEKMLNYVKKKRNLSVLQETYFIVRSQYFICVHDKYRIAIQFCEQNNSDCAEAQKTVIFQR